MRATVTTVRDTIRGVAARWRQQFPDADKPKQRTLRKLEALNPETATRADVQAAIGNSSWTDLRCNGCDSYGLPAIVTVGAEPDYESATASLCLDCIREAAAKLEAALAPEARP